VVKTISQPIQNRLPARFLICFKTILPLYLYQEIIDSLYLYKETDMAFDEGLAHRIRETLMDQGGLTEKKMFGGIAFMIHGNMACGVSGDEMMVRISPDEMDSSVAQEHVRPFVMTGKRM
jgi:hypothetical protein